MLTIYSLSLSLYPEELLETFSQHNLQALCPAAIVVQGPRWEMTTEDLLLSGVANKAKLKVTGLTLLHARGLAPLRELARRSKGTIIAVNEPYHEALYIYRGREEMVSISELTQRYGA